MLIFSSLLLTSCSERSGAGKLPLNDGRVTFSGENGEQVVVEINEDKDLDSYTIIRDDNAEKKVVELVVRLRSDIKNKAGAELDIATTIGGSASKQIVVNVDEKLGGTEYSVLSRGKKIYLSGGSVEALTKAVDMFVRNFVRSGESSVLVPSDGGYSYDVSYYFDKLTIDGVDFSEFSFYEAEGDASVINYNKKAKLLGDRLNEIFEKELIGQRLEFSKVRSKSGKQIVISSSSLNVNDYSLKIENGDIFLSGSFVSVEEAANVLLRDVFGYSEGSKEKNKVLDVSSGVEKEGSLGLASPYTKAQLLELFAEANSRNDMVITGTHTYGDQTNGSGIQRTVDNCIKATGESCAIMEIDVGQFGPFNSKHPGEDVLYQYDLSQLVSEGTKHVSEGGIIAIVSHFGNPLMNANDGTWYRGSLGSDAVVKEMLTEGTDLNKDFRATLEDTVRVVEVFSDNGIPVILRPFHEMNADWFWWCSNQGGGRALSAESMTDMWKYLYNIVTVERGAKEVLWVYSTSFNGSGKHNVLYAYPGDEYVDLTGIDWYTSGKQEYNYENSYSELMTLGKPTALTETGPGDALAKKTVEGTTYFTYSAVDLLNDIKQMLSEGLNVSYFATWVGRTVYNLEDGETLMKDPIMISREDLALRWAND